MCIRHIPKVKLKRRRPVLPLAAQRVVMDGCGESQLLPMGKLAITQQMGVQLRDLRLLDPQLATSYPSAILCRERALVVSQHS